MCAEGNDAVSFLLGLAEQPNASFQGFAGGFQMTGTEAALDILATEAKRGIDHALDKVKKFVRVLNGRQRYAELVSLTHAQRHTYLREHGWVNGNGTYLWKLDGEADIFSLHETRALLALALEETYGRRPCAGVDYDPSIRTRPVEDVKQETAEMML